MSTRPSSPSPLRVLVVEDEPLVARALQRTLRGYDVTTVDNVPDAVSHWLEGAYQLAFVDMYLGGHTGIDFHDRLVAADPRHAGRLAFMSGGSTDPEVSDFLRRQPNPVFAKPFDVAAVRGFVKRYAEGLGDDSETNGR